MLTWRHYRAQQTDAERLNESFIGELTDECLNERPFSGRCTEDQKTWLQISHGKRAENWGHAAFARAPPSRTSAPHNTIRFEQTPALVQYSSVLTFQASQLGKVFPTRIFSFAPSFL